MAQESIGRGDYYKPGQDDVVKDDARARYRQAINEKAPQVLESLERDVLPAYAEVCSNIEAKGYKVWISTIDVYHIHKAGYKPPKREYQESPAHTAWLALPETQARIRSGELKFCPPDEDEKGWHLEYLPLKEPWEKWVNTYSMTEEWLQEPALMELYYQWKDLQKPKVRRSEFPFGTWWVKNILVHGCPFMPQEMTFEFKFDHQWDPIHTRWSDFEWGLDRAYVAAKQAFREPLEQKLIELEYEPTPKKRDADLHFSWLIERNVNHKTWQQIADEYQLSQESARDGANSAAKLADIEVWSPGPGRPRKSVVNTI